MNNTNTWEACPICNGSGKRPGIDYGLVARLNTKAMETFFEKGHDNCTVCKGKKIISKLTGKPPQD